MSNIPMPLSDKHTPVPHFFDKSCCRTQFFGSHPPSVPQLKTLQISDAMLQFSLLLAKLNTLTAAVPGQAARVSQLIAPSPSAQLSSGRTGRALTAFAAELRVVDVEAQPG
jgi:hypothetical protein